MPFLYRFLAAESIPVQHIMARGLREEQVCGTTNSDGKRDTRSGKLTVLSFFLYFRRFSNCIHFFKKN